VSGDALVAFSDMKHLSAILLVASILPALACKSTSANATDAAIACTCGKPEADLDGCACARCIAGESNPDNPDCVCGSLSLGK
jgi:hypothetical protein